MEVEHNAHDHNHLRVLALVHVYFEYIELLVLYTTGTVVSMHVLQYISIPMYCNIGLFGLHCNMLWWGPNLVDVL